ncbi:hypothetical protein GCM10010346_60820 [Streptomyces chryseus]|uniref:PPM-type phosphatase domain-containing protein n=1 Tax=Streptomyces chryseus TaxID=68186 RepID=A0ABQ3EFH5_9ACTN|nr:hypothetical protein GCM10010346_60820 [Streptomyces chryseus]
MEIIAAVWDYWVLRRIPFKLLPGKDYPLLADAKYAHRGSSGKFVTVCPADEAPLRRVLTELGQYLDGRPGPYILSDPRAGGADHRSRCPAGSGRRTANDRAGGHATGRPPVPGGAAGQWWGGRAFQRGEAGLPVPYTAVTALSHPGLMREHNEDSLVAGPWTLCGTVTENPQTLVFPLGTPLVVAVADGLGGQPAGEVASSLVVRQLAALGASLDSEEAVRAALALCNRAVYSAADGDPDLFTMGTTIAGVVVLASSVLVFNVGDSKVFEASPQGFGQVSVDDSPLPPPGRRTTSAVTQTLGGSSVFSTVTPHVTTRALSAGDRYLVCTDGLTDPCPDEEIAGVLGEHDGARAAFELWKGAIEAGGPDNITFATVRVSA